MSSEYFIATALPHSAATDPHDGFHVSVFITPRLSPDGGRGRLGDFALFADWPATLAESELFLIDQNGPMETRILPAWRDKPELWTTVFPPDLEVRSDDVPPLTTDEWQSFPAYELGEVAKDLITRTTLRDPVIPVSPSNHPYFDGVRSALRQLRVPYTDDDEVNPDRQPQFAPVNEAGVTAAIEAQRERPTLRGRTAPRSPSAVEREWALATLSDSIRARRFYERSIPEDEPPIEVTAEQPEFHRRVGAAADHAKLLRLLGLVIDLVGDPARLRSSQWLGVRMIARGDPDVARSPRTVVTRLRDDTLIATPDATRAQEWALGAAALGDGGRFSVLTVDPDGSALKTERFVMSLPRLARLERQGDEVNAASPALRATGLAVARTGQSAIVQGQFERQKSLLSQLETPGATPSFFANDVTRGFRIEVYDSTARTWHSLHSRISSLHLGDDPEQPVYDDERNEGYLQGTSARRDVDAAAADVKVHEALFGWDGWSLSAPRPGNRVRTELVEAPTEPGEQQQYHLDQHVEPTPAVPTNDETPSDPFRFDHVVAPKTLPRLRYGRSYAFRAWGVDLAGNSRPHSLIAGGPHVGGLALDQLLNSPTAAAKIARLQDASRRFAATIPRAATGNSGATAANRSVSDHTAGAVDPAKVIGDLIKRIDRAAGPEATTMLKRGLTKLSATAHPPVLVRYQSSFASVRAAAAASATAMNPVAAQDVAALSPLLADHFSTLPGYPVQKLADLLDGVRMLTPLNPFLRWDPVQPPAMVAEREYTEGESLRVLVVRSGVTQNRATGRITVQKPEPFAADANASVTGAAPSNWPSYAAWSARHVAPPKSTQMTAELHGKFDGGIDSTADLDALRSRLLAAALREDGTFFDQDVANLKDPAGARVPLPYPVRLHTDSGLSAMMPEPGVSPGPGEYVVITTENIQLPYLPDPLAAGVSIAFPDAGRGRHFDPNYGSEVFTADYDGPWPDALPYRLALVSAPIPGTQVKGRTIEFQLPAGTSQNLLLSSSLRIGELRTLGVWRALPLDFTANPSTVEAARDGLIWSLTPHETVRLVHAVTRPVEAPSSVGITAFRRYGSQSAQLIALVHVHGQSTESVTAELRWTEVTDDPSQPGISRLLSSDVGFTIPIDRDETAAVLTLADAPTTLEGIAAHDTLHEFPDTRHRSVAYRLRATTRFLEYFHPSLEQAPPLPVGVDPLSDAAWPRDDGKSVVSSEFVVDVPSSARPEPPVVHSVLPLFRWIDEAEPDQPLARRRERRSGIRVYLQRPWFSSGDGELLAVLLQGPEGTAAALDDVPYASQWGADPIWNAGSLSIRRVQGVNLEDTFSLFGFDTPGGPGRPVAVTGALPLPLTTAPPDSKNTGTAPVVAFGYRPHFNAERQLWYADIAFEKVPTMWPFVRLAVSRYQPSSVPGAHLSTATRVDFVQLPPERVATVSRTDASHVRVVVTGRAEYRFDQRTPETRGRTVIATLQKYDASVGGDLAWTTVASTELEPRGTGITVDELIWAGEIDAGSRIPVRRPVQQSVDTDDPDDSTPPSRWRVRITEWEEFAGDPAAPGEGTGRAVDQAWERRIVYADDFFL